jgi:cytochrome c-type biogenesis protein CcsB
VSVEVDASLAQASNTLTYSAMLVYTGALVGYTLDLASRGSARSAAPVAAPVAAAVEARTPVAVAAGEQTVVEQAAPATGGTGETGQSGHAGQPGETGESGERARSRAAGIAVALTWLAFALHLGAVVARGLSAHRVPWGNMYEFSTSGAVVVTGVFLAVLLRRDVRYLGTFVVGPVLLTLGLAVTVLYTQSAQLVPALQSFWLVIHVSVAFVASALLTLGFSTTVLQLVQERRELARAAGRPPRGGRFMDALPGSVELERSAYRLHVVAFPLWTFTVIAGAIWAEAAWGRYWNWDPKEVWSFVIWVVYAGYLHARSTRGWDGRRSAYFALAGYACVLFNFLVVNIFFVGFHSYSGV